MVWQVEVGNADRTNVRMWWSAELVMTVVPSADLEMVLASSNV